MRIRTIVILVSLVVVASSPATAEPCSPPTSAPYGAIAAGEVGDLLFISSQGGTYPFTSGFAENSGHVGIFIGQANGAAERHMVEALGWSFWPWGDTGVKYTVYDLSQCGDGYFRRDTNLTFLGALTPITGDTALRRRNVVLLALDQVGEGYDEGFGQQKGPGTNEWICTGLAEKVWESADMNGVIYAGDQLPLQYNPAAYAVNITPDGFCNNDLFCTEYEHSDLFPEPNIYMPATMIYQQCPHPGVGICGNWGGNVQSLEWASPVPPTASPSFSSAQPPQNGWYRSDVTLTAIAADDGPSGSGIYKRYYGLVENVDPATPFTGPVTITASGTTVRVKAKDNAGYDSQIADTMIRIDSLAPAIQDEYLQPCDGCVVPYGRLEVGGKATDAGGSGAHHVVVQNAGTGLSGQGPVDGDSNFTAPIDVVIGTNLLTVIAYDLAGNPSSTTTRTVCAEADGDGYCGSMDCDDTNPYCTTDCADADGDGACVTHDPNDANPNCTTTGTDADADGRCADHDCNDNESNCTTDCTDADRDGLAACSGDCNDSLPGCTTDCTDSDHDGYCPPIDCDDAGAPDPSDGVSLRLSKGSGPGELALSWTGGQPTFSVLRSTSPSDPGDTLGSTADRAWADTPPPGDNHFYLVASPCVVSCPEVCDGEDNDCDGAIDETGSEVSCPYLNGYAVCLVGTCGTSSCAPNWWDINGNPVDGCEYFCVRQSMTDEPDAAFVDANCDGIDGDLARAVFVSPAPSGSDTNPGTAPDLPVATIARGIEVAADTFRTQVLVERGGYSGSRLLLQNAIGIFGNYEAGFEQRIATPDMTLFTASEATAMEAWNLSSPTVLEYLLIESEDAVAEGESSHGIRASWSPGLVVRNCTVVAGAGAPGASALAPGGTGVAGVRGAGGQAGSKDFESTGGAGGVGGYSHCQNDGGHGGAGSWNGANGAAGAGGVGVGGGGGGAGGFGNGSCARGGDGGFGLNGMVGAVGSDGAGGSGGSVQDGFWEGSAGASGNAGAPGGGGGGGGGGAGDHGLFCVDGTGNGGGGGGGGGCGGAAGEGGQAGGGSFGVFLFRSHGASIVSSWIESRNGGSGGTGAAGQSGGSGGPGGDGATAYSDTDLGRGGNGGFGGSGGQGGSGGGGAGGPSYSILAYETIPILAGNTLNYGSGGAGGASPGNPGAPGSSGPTTLE